MLACGVCVCLHVVCVCACMWCVCACMNEQECACVEVISCASPS